MARLFGTDGVRGLANDTLTPHLALQLGAAAAEVLAAHAVNGTGHPRVVLGRDPRISGEMLEAALAAGISSPRCRRRPPRGVTNPRCSFRNSSTRCRFWGHDLGLA